MSVVLPASLPNVINAPDAPGSLICSSMTRKRSLLRADIAVVRAASTSLLIRRACADGIGEAVAPGACASLAAGVEFAMYLICNFGPHKPVY